MMIHYVGLNIYLYKKKRNSCGKYTVESLQLIESLAENIHEMALYVEYVFDGTYYIEKYAIDRAMRGIVKGSDIVKT